VHQYLMTAVEAGTRTASGWADDLVYPTNLVSEFVELLRAQTIVDRIPGLRRVPFNIRMGTQSTGTTAYWVGEARPIPMSKLGTANLALDRHKVAALSALSEELARDSSPGAEAFIRDDMLKEVRELIDTSFIDPDRAEVSGISPASVTNGVTPVTPSGTDADALRTDLMTLLNKYATANLSPAGGVFIMTQTTANAVMFMTNALGQTEFPEFRGSGGMANLRGYPVIISQSALATSSPTGGNLIIFLVPGEIMLADDGEADVSFSKEASLEMETAPTNRADTGTGASLVSMYQNDSTAIKVRRFITWKKRRAEAVQFINDAEYTA
jgi:HK97 family phage major capsid protein